MRLVCLSIAGSDPSGGAGIQADLKTFSAFGVYGCAAIAGLTVQNTQGVRRAHPVASDLVVDQVTAVLDDLHVAATKIGMLSDAETVAAVADLVAARRSEFGILVLDPVMVATSGDRLLTEDSVALVCDRLIPLADLVTPNVPEAAALLGRAAASDMQEAVDQAKALVAGGARSVLVKGGHLDGDMVVDVLARAGEVVELRSPRIATRNTHGTGCTLSSAIAASAAVLGDVPGSGVGLASVERGRAYLQAALRGATDWELSRHPGVGHGPVDHLAPPPFIDHSLIDRSRRETWSPVTRMRGWPDPSETSGDSSSHSSDSDRP
ncbi:MAG: bifunctional hydroxymethylpyrimidine kinase/phosphomethylpyrimidine kinase [Propionibacteriaceae bacterium]